MSYPLEDGQHVLPANPPQPFSLGLCLQVTPPRHLPGPVLSTLLSLSPQSHNSWSPVWGLLTWRLQHECSSSGRNKEYIMKAGFQWDAVRWNPPSHQGWRLREEAQMWPEDAGKREGRAQTRVASPLNGQGPLICAPFTLNSSQGRSNWNVHEHVSLEWKFGGAEAFARCILLLGTLFSTAQ